MDNLLTLILPAWLVSMQVLRCQKSSDIFPPWSRLLVKASLCIFNIACPLQAVNDSGGEDILIHEVLTEQLGISLEKLDQSIPVRINEVLLDFLNTFVFIYFDDI